MRRTSGTLLGLGLLVPLSVAPAVPAAASAAPAVPAAAASQTALDTPWSSFKVSVKAPKRVRNGQQFMYEVKVTNRGPHKADFFFIGGTGLPKGINDTVYYKGPKGTDCDFYDDGFWCITPWILEKGDSESVKIWVKLKKGTKGTAVAKLGVDTWNVPTGGEKLDRSEWKRLAFPHWYFLKTVKTKIVHPAPPRRGGGGSTYTPPPTPQPPPPPDRREEKKDT
ncbi:hypothetical protein [Planomonospora venezuelensis]|uniref:DUF11 domain-containing protein n=1 Tax=Planomonospora venezuelensis TaxID=1999 RepID=A0A841CUW9_PLAVE|nr:hypothetical protein [Planomonospora venezuelensis]MBB5961140.1 hypothetical protein [Planomonospora venezuelensis]GIM99810.1 hypothetical protein Pve01_14690 [Planomonospora venezuelensis]